MPVKKLKPKDQVPKKPPVGSDPGYDNRPFNIQGEHGSKHWGNRPACHVPWWLAEIAYDHFKQRQGKVGEEKSLGRINERGGFGRDEFVDLIRRGVRNTTRDDLRSLLKRVRGVLTHVVDVKPHNEEQVGELIRDINQKLADLYTRDWKDA